MAPEVLARQPSRPASDVYSFGKLIEVLVETVIQDVEVRPSLQVLCSQATMTNPLDRPTLETVLNEIVNIYYFVWGEEL